MEFVLRQKSKSSHVDCWLYENAEPWKEFDEVNYDECGKVV